MQGTIGIGYWRCANGETWEFCLTIDGHRVGRSIYQLVGAGRQPTSDDLTIALNNLMRRA